MWRFLVLFESLMQKMKEIVFPYFIYYKLSSKSIFNLKICVVLDITSGKFCAKKFRKFIKAILKYANFSYICTPKPAGRIDPSTLERVKGTLPPKKRPNFENFFFLLLMKYEHVADVVEEFYSCSTCVKWV